MSPLKWDPTLDTGHELIDAQHRALLALISKVAHATSAPDSGATAAALEVLSDYVAVHFAAEEELMREHGFPHADAEVHQAEHRSLTERTRALILEYRRDPGWAAADLVDFLVEWLTHHIDQSDRRLAHHVRHGGPTGQGAEATA